MAFGSATVTRTRTKTKAVTTTRARARTKITGSVRSSTKYQEPLLPPSDSDSSSSSSSSRPPSRRAPSPRARVRRDPQRAEASEDSEDDKDFGTNLHEEVKREVQGQNQAELEKRQKRERKELRDRGEKVPDHLKGSTARSSKASVDKGKLGRRPKKELKPEERALIEGLEPGRGKPVEDSPATERGYEGKGKARQMDEGDDGVSERPTKPTFDWTRKKKETEKRNKIKLDACFFENSALHRVEAVVKSAALSEPVITEWSEGEIRKHLARRWTHKADPLAMTGMRKAMEQKFNPLIRLLDVKITVVEDEESLKGGTSDSDPSSSTGTTSASESGFPRKREKSKRTTRRNETYVVGGVDTDDEEGGGDLEPSEARDFTPEEDDANWSSDGMGGQSAHWVMKRKAAAPVLCKHERSGAGGVKMEVDSIIKVRDEPEDVKLRSPTSQLDRNDDSEEPSTSTEDEGETSLLSLRRHRQPDHTSISRTIVNAGLALKVGNGSHHHVLEPRTGEDDEIELLDEPDTEPSDIDSSSLPLRPSAQPLQPQRDSSVKLENASQQWMMEVERQEHLLKRRTESQSQSQSLPPCSISAQSIVVEAEVGELDGDGDEDEEDVDEQTLRLMKQQAAKARAAEEKRTKQEQREKRRREEREALESRSSKRSDQGTSRWNQSRLQEEEEKEEGAEEEEDFVEEPPAWAASNAVKEVKPKVILPYLVEPGRRPEFLVQTLEQHRTGPHQLDADGAEIPGPINKFLRPYQREGVEFLWGQWKKRIGGILGDDMGLGKTIQVIAFLSAVMDKKGVEKRDVGRRKKAINRSKSGIDSATDLGPTCLIACPASVRGNWEREFETWGYFDVAVYEGNKDQRAKTLHQFKLGYVDVLIVGLESVRDQIEEFRRLPISLVIVDEAHRLKTPQSALTMAFHQFPTPFRYGLTGTAIQNNLDEMWCILNFANPGHVGVLRQWRDLISTPLKHAQKREATARELALGRSRASALVGILLPHFWLRRTKESVQLQLPRKRDNIVLCPLTDLQKDVYRRILALEDVKTILTADDPCACGEKDPKGLPYRSGLCCKQGWTKLIFKYIVLFQKISNHLALIYPDRSEQDTNGDKYEQDVVWSKAAFPDDYQKRKPGRTAFADPQLCGKWKVLCELLDLWYKNGDKVLIFSMSLKVLDLLSELMETTHYNYLVLDGKTPAEARMGLVDEFNDPNGNKFAFLISTRAGGVGLNLKAANKVVIFDPNWNPSHDLQAMDRSHRFGQTKEVDVFRLVGAGTLEELILNRQQYKRAQAGVGYDATAERRLYSGVQGEGKEHAGELWGVKNIFKFSEHISLTEKSIRQMELEELEYARDTELDPLVRGGDPSTPPPLPDYSDEKNADGLVAEMFGLKTKDESRKKLTTAELERLRRHEEEQARISSILGGRITVQSDSVLGGSKVEEYRSREALKAATGNKSKGKVRQSSLPARPSARLDPASNSHKRKSSTGPLREVNSDEEDDLAVYNPNLRQKKQKTGAGSGKK